MTTDKPAKESNRRHKIPGGPKKTADYFQKFETPVYAEKGDLYIKMFIHYLDCEFRSDCGQ